MTHPIRSDLLNIDPAYFSRGKKQPKKQEDTGELRDKILSFIEEAGCDFDTAQEVMRRVDDHTAKAVAEAEDRVHRAVCPTCIEIDKQDSYGS